MKKSDQYRIILISYIVAIVITLIIDYLISVITFANSFFDIIRVTTVLTVWWWFYFNYGWKIPFFNLILYQVNLNGTWFGVYNSYSLQDDSKASADIGLRITQDYLTISINSFTEKFQNFSYSEEVRYEEKSNQYGLIYVYSQSENDVLDVNNRNGAAELIIKRYKDNMMLEGEFWTVHGTRGKISVKKISNTSIDTFEEAKEIFVTKFDNKGDSKK